MASNAARRATLWADIHCEYTYQNSSIPWKQRFEKEQILPIGCLFYRAKQNLRV